MQFYKLKLELHFSYALKLNFKKISKKYVVESLHYLKLTK